MAQPLPDDQWLTVEQVEKQYGVRRSTLYRYMQKGSLPTFRRGMDKRIYLRRTEIEALRRLRPARPRGGPTAAAVERARAFQRRVFGERVLTTPSADLIEEARRERTEDLS